MVNETKIVSELSDAGQMSLEVLIRESLDSFSASERKIGRVILANYPIAGLETVAELAKRSQVSPPTVIRFVGRLGFSGYPVFQKQLIREVHEKLGSPLEQYDRDDLASNSGQLPQASMMFQQNIRQTFEELPRSEFDAAVERLANPRRAIRLAGGRFSQIIADYLATHLKFLRSDVHTIGEDESSRLTAIVDTSHNDITVVFDYRRYDPDVVKFARVIAAQGSEIILFTDRWLSPAAEFATVVLPARVESPSPFDSFVPALAAVEAVIAGVTAALGDGGRKRVEAVEAMRPQSAFSLLDGFDNQALLATEGN